MPSTMTDLKGKGKESDALSSNTAAVPPASSTTSTKHAATVAEDDDDDDLDELDDVLDQFNAAPPTQAASSKQDPHDRSNKGASSNNGEANNDSDDDEGDDEDFEAIFAAELAKEVERMMGSMQPPTSTSGTEKKAGLAGNTATNGTGLSLPDLDDEEKALLEDKDLKAAFERIMASATAGGGSAGIGGDDDFSMEELSKLMNGLGGGAGGLPDFGALASGSSSSSTNKAAPTKNTANGSSKAPPTKPKNFEDALQATMSRLADSEAQHKSHTAKGAKGSDDPLAALMAQMEAMGGLPGMGGGNGAAGGGDENLPEVLDSLMDQLMSKELLHEPITELKHKYPEYLKSPEAASITAEERQRYEKQEVIVNQIYTIFEDPKYDTASQATREKVADLMQQMQECGAPPKPLMGELGPAMAMGADGIPNIDPDNCIIS